MYDALADELWLPDREGTLRKLSDPLPPPALEIILLSAVPLSRLGDAPRAETAPVDCLVRRPYPELLVFTFLIPKSEFLCFSASGLLFACTSPTFVSIVDVNDAANGLGGRLFTRELILGGAGKVPMLLVFRTAFPGVGMAADNGELEFELAFDKFVVLSVGTAGVDWVLAGFGVGSPEVVTARVRGLIAGVGIDAEVEPVEPGRDSEASGVSGSGFLVFARGNAGKGPEGGGEIGGGGRDDGLCGMAEDIVVIADTDIAMSRTRFRCKYSPTLAVSFVYQW